MIKRDPTRFLQIGFLALLFLCVLQVGWWILDNLRYTGQIQHEIETLAADDPRATAALDDIAVLSEGRANQYLWEGGFFLIVLIGGMAVLTRTLRHDAELRRRQQNFLAAVSHEFKSPLASMQLSAETLVLRSSEPDSQRLGRRLLEDCERLLRMVDNLLDTTRLEEGRQPFTAEKVGLHAAVASVADEFAERASRHGIALETDVADGLALSIDRTAFETMLRNLIDNALKACVAARGKKILIAGTRENGRVSLSVHDDGLGFPPEDAKLMFEKFYRLGDELTRKTPGTGLGLYIVRRLAELSGAEVEAASDGPERGATVTLRWPEEGAA
jgi:signal transduction histidine kinase